MKTNFGLNLRAIIWLLFAAGALVIAVAGCSTKTQSGFASADDKEEEVETTREPLGLLAIGLPQFDEEVALQWAAERDGDLKISHLSIDEFLQADQLPKNIDLIVHPSVVLVDLISKNMIRTYPRKGLDDPTMNLDSFLTHFRRALVRHDDKTWSVSLGGHQLKLFYRKDILEAAGVKPPKTWDELERGIEKLSSCDEANGMTPVVFPTANGMAAQVYLARVSSLIRDQGKLTSFFDRKEMKPTIEAAVFANALNDMKFGGGVGGESLSVEEAFTRFVSGNAVFAIGWPEIADDFDKERLEEASRNWGVSRLPGARRYFDLNESSWRDRRSNSETNVDLLGSRANCVSITKGTRNSAGAVELIMWLTEKRNSQKLLPGIAAPFRATHLGRVGQWYELEQAQRQFIDQFADTIDETHRSRIVLIFPQIPGKHLYLEMLDATVLEFLKSEDVDAQAALQKLAKQWDELTDKLGRTTQLKELRRANGI